MGSIHGWCWVHQGSKTIGLIPWCPFTLPPCAPDRVIKGCACDALAIGHCTERIQCLESSRVVILFAGFSKIFLRYLIDIVILPCGGPGWWTLMGLPEKIAEKHHL